MLDEKKLAFMASLDFASWEEEKILESLSTLGYNGVEWTLTHFNPKSKSKKKLQELVTLTRKYNLETSEIVVQQDVVTLDEELREDRIDLVKDCIAAASEVGVNVINLFSGPAPWDPEAPKVSGNISEEKAWDQVLKAYEQFVKLAEKYKVYLAVEAVWGHLCHDYYTTRELVNCFDSEFLGINMDPSHYVLYGNDISWVVKKWGRRIKHVHLKDVIGNPGSPGKDFIFPLLGEGMVNWKLFFQALDEVGYEGFFSVEFESFNYYCNILNSDPVKAARISMEQARELMKLQ